VSPIHRDGAGDRIAAPTWESLSDRLIREAQERGEWETGAWAGRRLPAQDGVYESELAAGNAVLRNAGAAPSWIETDKDARRLLAERDRLLELAGRTSVTGAAFTRARFAACLDALDATLLRLETEAPSPAQQRPRIDRAAELAAFEGALGGVPRPGQGGAPSAGRGTGG
jgi:hypothetical protein